MQNILNLYHSVPHSTWAVLAGALTVSGVTQALKHFFFKQFSPKAIMSITTGVSFLAVVLNDFISTTKANPSLLGQETAAVLGTATLAYRFLVGPAYCLLLDAKTYRATAAPAAPEAETPAPTEASF